MCRLGRPCGLLGSTSTIYRVQIQGAQRRGWSLSYGKEANAPSPILHWIRRWPAGLANPAQCRIVLSSCQQKVLLFKKPQVFPYVFPWLDHPEKTSCFLLRRTLQTLAWSVASHASLLPLDGCLCQLVDSVEESFFGVVTSRGPCSGAAGCWTLALRKGCSPMPLPYWASWLTWSPFLWCHCPGLLVAGTYFQKHRQNWALIAVLGHLNY